MEAKNNNAGSEGAGEFTAEERAALRQTAKEREHRAWLFDAVKRLVLYASAVIVGLGVVWDAVERGLRSIAAHLK